MNLVDNICSEGEITEYVKDGNELIDSETTWTVEMLLFNLPPILSEPQYLLCWLTTFLIVWKQLKKNRRQVNGREMVNWAACNTTERKINGGYYFTQKNNDLSK